MILGLLKLRQYLKTRPRLLGPRLLAAISWSCLAGCASESTVREYVPKIVTPYRIDIQQGNFLTPDMVEKLAVGQTRDQVRFIFGTPLLTDIFHANRWDYVFRSSKGWNDPLTRKLVIFFDAGGHVERWSTDVLPLDAPAPAAAAPDPVPAPAAPAPRAQGLGMSGARGDAPDGDRK